MQMRPPMAVLDQIVSQVLGQQNVPGIATIHHALGHIDSRSRDIERIINISDLINRSAVNSHPQLDVGVTTQRYANIERASHRLLRAAEKKKRHPITGWHPDEFATCFSRPKTCGAAHDLFEFLEQLNLFVD